MLKFDSKWRLEPPPDGDLHNKRIPEEALSDFVAYIGKVATQGERWKLLEHFKGAFCRAAGQSHFWSSSESWAEGDLSSAMSAAAENAPLFLEAFYEACAELVKDGYYAPDAEIINNVCRKHGLGYVLKPPELILCDSHSSVDAVSVTVSNLPPTIAEEAVEVLQQSLGRSEQLLKEGRHREAVQETLWVIESVATAFRGLEMDSGEAVRGKYFNVIVRELRGFACGPTLARALDWMNSLYGFLSSPTGGGVRHGVDLSAGITIGFAEARLFCNLIRSYTGYLLAEYKRLSPREF